MSTVKNAQPVGESKGSDNPVGLDASTIISPKQIEEQKKEAKLQAERRKLPPAPGKHVTKFKQFRDWAEKLTDEHWSHVEIYVYRLYPEIIRQLSDPSNDNNIDVIAEFRQCNEEYFVSQHGGGKYKLLVSDRDNTRDARYFTCIFDIPISEYRPKFDLQELNVDAKANRGFVTSLKGQGYIDGLGNIVDKKSGGGDGDMKDLVISLIGQIQKMSATQIQDMKQRAIGSPTEAALTKAVELAQSGGEKSLDFMIKQMEQQDPNKGMATVTALISAMKEFFPKPESKGDSAMMPLVLKMMETQAQQTREHQKEVLGLVKEIAQAKAGAATANPSEQPSELDTLEKVLSVADRIGGGSGKPRPWWESAIEHGAPVAMGIVQAINSSIALRRTAAPAGGGKPGEPEARLLPGMTPQMMATGQHGHTATPAATAKPMTTDYSPSPGTTPAATPGSPGTIAPELDPQAVALIGNFGGAILNTLKSNGAGDDLAHTVVTMAGFEHYSTIAQLGPEKLLGAMKAIQEFWAQAQVFGEDNIRQFISDFLAYPQRLREDADAGAEEVPAEGGTAQ